jgi:hypothetical protein
LKDVHKYFGPVCITICAVLLTSCAEDVVIDYSQIAPRVIVQSRLSPNAPFTISVTSSLAPDSQSEYEILNDVEVAVVDVTEKTGAGFDLYLENGVYIAPQDFPVAGRSYKVFVLAQGFPTAEATYSIHLSVELVTLRIGVANLDTTKSESTPDKLNLSYDL